MVCRCPQCLKFFDALPTLEVKGTTNGLDDSPMNNVMVKCPYHCGFEFIEIEYEQAKPVPLVIQELLTQMESEDD